jgi:tripartite-type tricarboxylate transporter receptor subunit TctC
MVIPHAPAGPADIVARELSHYLSTKWGESIINDNRSGANGSIGAEIVVKSPPDGHTLLLTSMGVVAVNPTLNNLKFDPLKDLIPIALVANSSNVLVVSPNLGVKNLQEFIQLVKANPQKMNYGSAGVGTASHLSMELFNETAGLKMLHVPYKGASPAVTDLISNQVQAFMSGTTGALSYIQTGKLIALGVTSSQSIEILPSTAPIAKVLPGFELGNWYGLFAPAGTPKEIIQQISQDVQAILQSLR